MELIRNPRDRNVIRIVSESRFIASSDLALIDGRGHQEVSGVLKSLRAGRHIRVVYSAQRLPKKSFLPKKTYIYGSGKRGHILHWVHLAHSRALFTKAARELGIQLDWSQANKHYRSRPDASVSVRGHAWTLEVDNSTEGKSLGGIFGKPLKPNTITIAFKGEERFKNLCRLPGLHTWHGYFHKLESDGFNILTAKCFWDSYQGCWVSLI